MSLAGIATRNSDECVVDRYDVLLALMKSSEEEDELIQKELSKIIRNISLMERETRQYVKTLKIQVSGNERVLEYIKKMD